MSASASEILAKDEIELLFSLDDSELESILKPLPTEQQTAILTQMATYRTPTEMATERLIEFVKQAWHIVEPDTEFRDGWHIEAICTHLEAVTKGDVKDLLINVPPGCMKSLLCSVFWPAWVWISNPSARFFYSSYDQQLSVRDSLKCRYIIESPWYRERWGSVFSLVGDQNQKTRYDTTARGWRLSTSVGGRGTGEHPDFVVVDDPHNVKKSTSPVDRQSVRDWWDGTISSRGKVRGVRRVIIMQRLHEEDLAGHVLKKGGFDHICLPMRFEPERRTVTSLDWTDPRTDAGELLWPDAYSLEKVKELETDMGEIRAAGQLQQRPNSNAGFFFKIGKLEIVDAAPAELRCVRAWDIAATAGEGDYTAGVKMGKDAAGIFYIVDVTRGQWGTDERDGMIKLTASLDGRQTKIWIPQDPGAAGKSMVLAFIRLLAGYTVKSSPVTGDKENRADPFSSQVNAGNVKLVRGDWNHDFIEELRGFPVVSHDDQVDAASDAFTELTSKRTFAVA